MTARKRHVAVSEEPSVGGSDDAAEAVRETVGVPRGDADVLRDDTRELSDRLAGTLAELAVTMKHSAGIAERVAERAVQLGRSDVAESERRAAKRARGIANRVQAAARTLRRRARP